MNPSPEEKDTFKSDEEALETIGMLEAEDNPSIETSDAQALSALSIPISDDTSKNENQPFPNPLGSTDNYDSTFSSEPIKVATPFPINSGKDLKEELAETEHPIISGPQKSSKLLIVILIIIILLAATGIVAYLKYTKFF